MGLLDDAIREHLELKRRRGADPAEIEQAEREALGPVRRYQAADVLDDQHEPLEGDDVLYDDEEEEWHEPPPEAPAGPGRSSTGDYDELDAPLADDDPAAPAPAVPPPSSADHLEAETSEYDVAAKDDPEAEDVLEETPDFLQDTPDHDRLWFEQRPPRDFDFDG